jgi:Mor family transcriptional regulator
VGVLAHYSNRPDLLDELTTVQHRLSTNAGKTDSERRSVASEAGQPSRPYRVTDRLTAQEIDALIACYQAGTSARDLAERYGLGQTTIKQLLRERKVRRKDQGNAA